MTKIENAQKCDTRIRWARGKRAGWGRTGVCELSEAPADKNVTTWPLTVATDQCGEFEPKAAVRSTQAE